MKGMEYSLLERVYKELITLKAGQSLSKLNGGPDHIEHEVIAPSGLFDFALH